jgi:predicted amidohydrolase YtcJ
MRTLLGGGTVLAGPGFESADWVLLQDRSIAATGSGDEPACDRRIDLDGATVVPAFCDAHVHLPATGLYLEGMDFRGERVAARIAAAFARRAVSADAVLFGGNFEDPLDEPLDRRALDAAVGDRPALVARADLHSCVVSSALLRLLDVSGLDGVDRDSDGAPTGYLREAAAGVAWRSFERSLPRAQQRGALERAARHALSKGVGTVHEMHVVEWRGWDALDVTLEFSRHSDLGVVVYVATADVERVAGLGLGRIGGDFFLDGSFGSHSAWLSEPYQTPPPRGTPPLGVAYRRDDEVVDFFFAAQERGLQVGVHAIGDAAIEQALRSWEAVAGSIGADAVRARGHRIEHFECATEDDMRRAAALGLRASVQPAFDLLWGGDDGMYAQRIGAARAASMNRFATMMAHGLVVGAGSDSAVTPLDPFLQMRALRGHHVSGERVAAAVALRAHTTESHRLADGADLRGTIEPGKRADLAVLDRNPLEVDDDALGQTLVLRTWRDGRVVWPDPEPL